MIKSVLNSNIQIIITNMQHTIDVLSSMCSNNLLSKEQMLKYSNILNARVHDDDNYKHFTGDVSNLNLAIKRIQSERLSLKKLINDLNSDIYFLSASKDESITLKSEYQRENTILKNSLNIADDDKLKQDIENNNILISKVQQQIDTAEHDILSRQERIDSYNNDVKKLEERENRLHDHIDSYTEFVIDENKRDIDKIKLNVLNRLINTIDVIEKYGTIINKLEEIYTYVSTRGAKQEVLDSKLADIKSVIGEINGVLYEFESCIDIDEVEKERASIIAKSSHKNTFLTEEQRKERDKIITYLRKESFIYDSNGILDEQSIKDYNGRIAKMKSNISKLEFDNSLLQNEVDNLNLRHVYVIRDIEPNDKDEILRMIKKLQKQIVSNNKEIERFNRSIIDLETVVKGIKKVRRNEESLKENTDIELESLKNNTYVDDRYNLDSAKREIMIIDFVISMYKAVNDIIDTNYLKMIDDIEKESDKPYIRVIAITDYANRMSLVNPEFVEGVKMSIDKIITQGSPEYRSERYIAFLNAQGLQVVNSGRPLTNTSAKEDSKTKLLDGDNNGK